MNWGKLFKGNKTSRASKIILAVILGIILLSFPTPQDSAYADLPSVLVSAGIWTLKAVIVAGLTGGAAVAVNAIKDADSEDKETKHKASMTESVTVRDGDTEIKVEDSLEVDPPINSFSQESSISFPEDFEPQPTLPGFQTLGLTTTSLNLQEKTLSWSGQLTVGSTISDEIEQEFEMTESIVGFFRPTDISMEDSVEVQMSTDLNVVVSTTDIANTFATAGFRFQIFLPQMNKFVFDGGAEIDQGSTTFRLLGEHLLEDNISVDGPGVITINFPQEIKLEVTGISEFLDFEVHMIYFGKAKSTN